MYVSHSDIALIARLRAAAVALGEQQAKLDARFTQWIDNGCDTGGAIAQRNMERKRDRLVWAYDDLISRKDVGRLLEGAIGQAWWDAYVSADDAQVVAAIDRAMPELERIASDWAQITRKG